MRKTVFFAIIVLSLAASSAHAGAVSCGPEGSLGSTFYDDEYTSRTPSCHAESATVFAYEDCIDQFGNACRITWNENYSIHYSSTYDPPLWECDATSSNWVSNTNIVNPCQ